MSEVSAKVMAKADAYLTDGKVRVLVADSPFATHHWVQVEGTDTYNVRHQGGHWTCDCPARVLECAHVVAARKVVHVKDTDPVIPSTTSLEELLGE